MEAAKEIRTWTSDTLLKRLGIEDEAVILKARDAFLANVKKFETRVDTDPAPGVKARLVIGRRGGSAISVELKTDGKLSGGAGWRMAEDGSIELDRSEYGVEQRMSQRTKLNAWQMGRALESFAGSIEGGIRHGYREAGVALGELDDTPKGRRFAFLLSDIVKKGTRAKMAHAIREFRQHLDPEILKIQDTAGMHAIEAYNALRGDPERPESGRNVRQACRAYPLFSELICSGSGALKEAIAAGGSVRKAIEAEFGRALGEERHKAPGAAVIGRLQGVHWQRVGRAAFDDPIAFIGNLSGMPIDRMPKTKAEWGAFAQVAEEVAGLRGDNYFLKGGRVSKPEVLGELSKDWRASAALAAKARIADVEDALYYVARHALQTKVAGKMASLAEKHPEATSHAEGMIVEGMIDAVAGGRTVTALMQMSLEAHKRHGAMAAGFWKIGGNDRVAPEMMAHWGKAVDDWTAPNGLKVVMLAGESDLVEEGARQGHCVSGYTEACIKDRIIASVRTQGGDIVSTVEFVQGRDGLEIRQNRGAENEEAPRKAVDAAKQWMKALETGAIALDLEGLAKGRERAKERIAATRIHGYPFDPDDPEKRQQAFEAVRRFLPNSAKGLDADGWAAKVGIDGIVDASYAKAIEAVAEQRRLREEEDRRYAERREEERKEREFAKTPEGRAKSEALLARLLEGMKRRMGSKDEDFLAA